MSYDADVYECSLAQCSRVVHVEQWAGGLQRDFIGKGWVFWREEEHLPVCPQCVPIAWVLDYVDEELSKCPT